MSSSQFLDSFEVRKQEILWFILHTFGNIFGESFFGLFVYVEVFGYAQKTIWLSPKNI